MSIALLLAMSACSSQDPGAISFASHQPPPTSDTASSDSGASPRDTPADSGAAATPSDAGAIADASADVSAMDASDAPSGPAVTSFSLIDTSITNVVQGSPVSGYDPIKNGTTISLAQVGTSLSVRANLNVTTIGSVGFVYDATNHTENVTPYMLCGDNGAGVITNCNLAAGAHTITATPYSAANLAGTAGTPLTLSFTLAP